MGRSLRLGKHVVFFFFDVMANALGQDGEFSVEMIVVRVHGVQFGDEELGDMMFLIGLIHHPVF